MSSAELKMALRQLFESGELVIGLNEEYFYEDGDYPCDSGLKEVKVGVYIDGELVYTAPYGVKVTRVF